MKKIIYLLPVLALFFSACNPLDDINTQIDAQVNPVVGDANYTLTDADYKALNLTYGSFSSLSDAKTMLPAFLTGKYPTWGKGSSVLVDYKLYLGNAFKVSTYSLSQDDYTSSGSNLLGFKFDATPATYLADILTANISTPAEGDVAVAQYFQFSGAAYTITPTVSLEEDFDYGATAGDLTAVATDWTAHSGAGSGPVGYIPTGLSMTNYPSITGGAATISATGAEDVNKTFTPITSGTVYFSALVNLSSVGAGTYFIHFMDDTYGYSARVGAKDDGSGKISFGIGASATPSDYSTTSYDLNTTYLLVASYNIDNGTSNLYVLTAPTASEPATPTVTNTGNAGLTVQKIAIRQGGGGPSATIDGVRVANTWSAIMTNDVLPDVVIGDKVAKESVYTYANGAWEIPTNVYVLVADDYNSMGTASGQPGKYDNFDSSMPPDTYITKFLGIKYPYAKDGDEMKVIYKYYSGGVQTRGNLYTVVNGVWTAYLSTQETTLQFANDGTTWVPDNTIKYELVNADYEYISAQLATDSDYADLYVSLGKYHDFDYHWTEAQIVHALGILADYLNPTAEEGQKYSFTYLLYDNGTNNVSKNIIKTNGVWVLNN